MFLSHFKLGCMFSLISGSKECSRKKRDQEEQNTTKFRKRNFLHTKFRDLIRTTVAAAMGHSSLEALPIQRSDAYYKWSQQLLQTVAERRFLKLFISFGSSLSPLGIPAVFGFHKVSIALRGHGKIVLVIIGLAYLYLKLERNNRNFYFLPLFYQFYFFASLFYVKCCNEDSSGAI